MHVLLFCVYLQMNFTSRRGSPTKTRSIYYRLFITFFHELFYTAVANAAKLMGCSFNELKLVLSTHKEQSGKDSIAKKSTLQQVAFYSSVKSVYINS